MNQDEINRVEQACLRLGYNYEQINFIVGVVRNHVEPVRQQLSDLQENADNLHVEVTDLRQQLAETEEACKDELARSAERNAKLRRKLAASQQALRNVYEVWAGSEGIPKPENAVEGYLLSLVEQMRDAAKEGMK